MLMEQILSRENLIRALNRVVRNKGSHGVDEMPVQNLRAHVIEHWDTMKVELLSGTYQPQPVRRVEIPKPDGGVRLLGIPTVMDRFIQQAIAQVLSSIYDPTFSDHSYGFRPNRSAHGAVKKAKGYIAEGNRWVVDIDLEKFFDKVNHDKLMGQLAKRIEDKRLLKLIHKYLMVVLTHHHQALLCRWNIRHFRMYVIRGDRGGGSSSRWGHDLIPGRLQRFHVKFRLAFRLQQN